jgi:D-serine deaminase-like pyridoxal phosphate-dependent protein
MTAAPSTRAAAVSWQRLHAATAHLDPPFAVLDLRALESNAADLVRRANGLPIRVASKSVRCRAVLRRVLALPGYHGILGYTLSEALWLATEFDDIVVAYPTAEPGALRRLAADPARGERITLMVDGVEQLDFIDATLAESAPASSRAPIRVAIDLDSSLRGLGGRLHLGVRRSPVHQPDDARSLALAISSRRGFRLVGLMAYEAQIAGVGNAPPGRPFRGAAVRAMQSVSVRELAARRHAMIAAVREVTPLEFVNGGGTGSIERTAAEPAVTEVTAGSGFYAPTLFDHYSTFSLRPAAHFALPVVRRPAPNVVTVLGGGYVASGAAEKTRLPTPALPPGLRLDSQEGAGEVQTPLLGTAARDLRVGDRVYFRHAKAGELCERFDTLLLVEGDRVVDEVPTYRGEGKALL